MKIEVTNEEREVMKQSLYSLSAEDFVEVVNGVTQYHIYPYTHNAMRLVFKDKDEIAKAVKKLEDLGVEKGDYFWLDENRKVFAIKSNQTVEENLEDISMDINTIVDEMSLNMSHDFAEQYDLPLAYIIEDSVHTFLEENIHFLSEDKVREIIETEIFAKNKAIAEIKEKDDKLVVRFKNSNFVV